MFSPKFDPQTVIATLTGSDPVTSLIRAVDGRLLTCPGSAALPPSEEYAPAKLGHIPQPGESIAATPFPPLASVERDLRRAAYILALWMLRNHQNVRTLREAFGFPPLGDEGCHAIAALQLLVSRARSGGFALQANRENERPAQILLVVPDGLHGVCHIGAKIDVEVLLPARLFYAVCTYAMMDGGTDFLSSGTGAAHVPIAVYGFDPTQLPRFADKLLEVSRRLPK